MVNIVLRRYPCLFFLASMEKTYRCHRRWVDCIHCLNRATANIYADRISQLQQDSKQIFKMTTDKQIANEIMENYPEFSSGNVLQCYSWDYKKGIYKFDDVETGKTYTVTTTMIVKALSIFKNKVRQGRFKYIQSSQLSDIGNYDAVVVDAIVQIAIFDDIIYG